MTAVEAKAQCVQAPMIPGQGYQGGSPCWGGAPQQFAYANNFQPTTYGQQFVNSNQPSGHWRECTIEESTLKNAGKAINYGIGGALIGGDRRTASQAAGAGFIISEMSGCRVWVETPHGQQVVYVSNNQQQNNTQYQQSQINEFGCYGDRHQGTLDLPGDRNNRRTVCALPGDRNISYWIN